MKTLSWHRRLRGRVRDDCPSCGRREWIGDTFGPLQVLLDPNSPRGHPELPFGVDGIPVLPVTCPGCGYTALYAVEHFETSDPWAD